MQALICAVRVHTTSEWSQIPKWNFAQAVRGFVDNWAMHSLSLCSWELYQTTPKRGRQTAGSFAHTCQQRLLELYPVVTLIAGAERGATPTAREMVALWQSLDSWDEMGLSPLWRALQMDAERARLLLQVVGVTVRTESPAPADYPGELMHMIVQWRVGESTKAAVSQLIEQGADIDQLDSEGATPLMRCVEDKGDVAWVNLLISLGADVHHSPYGESLLHKAALCAGPTMVITLLKAGANITARNNDGKTPLECAHKRLGELLEVDDDETSHRVTTRKAIIAVLEAAEAGYRQGLATASKAVGAPPSKEERKG
jgi:hypothetical protein